jgi:hypothetical protein
VRAGFTLVRACCAWRLFATLSISSVTGIGFATHAHTHARVCVRAHTCAHARSARTHEQLFCVVLSPRFYYAYALVFATQAGIHDIFFGSLETYFRNIPKLAALLSRLHRSRRIRVLFRVGACCLSPFSLSLCLPLSLSLSLSFCLSVFLSVCRSLFVWCVCVCVTTHTHARTHTPKSLYVSALYAGVRASLYACLDVTLLFPPPPHPLLSSVT